MRLYKFIRVPYSQPLFSAYIGIGIYFVYNLRTPSILTTHPPPLLLLVLLLHSPC